MSKNVLKVYELPDNIRNLEREDNSTSVKFNLDIAFEEISKSFAEQEDASIIKWLYNKYKGTNVSKVYVLSEEEFKDFLIKMLPKYKGLIVKHSNL